MDATFAAVLGVVLVIALLIFKWRFMAALTSELQEAPLQAPKESEVLLCQPTQLVPRLSSYNIVKGFEVEEKDSLDEHLDVLASRLAEKESYVRLSKSKIRETQNEMQNLHAIDNKTRLKYRDIMDSLRTELMNNEKDCRTLQEQIEWVSHRRAELKEEVRRGHKQYGIAAAELACNLEALQKGRTQEKPTGKLYTPPLLTSRLRKPTIVSPPVPFVINPSQDNLTLRESFFYDPI